MTNFLKQTFNGDASMASYFKVLKETPKTLVIQHVRGGETIRVRKNKGVPAFEGAKTEDYYTHDGVYYYEASKKELEVLV